MKKFKLLIIIIFFFLNTISLSLANDLKSKKVNEISKNLRCLICQGQSVYDSQSDFAISIKILIKKKIDEEKKEE